MTEHCQCGAPPDGADEHHACVKSVEPLRVHVARALGCHVIVETDISGGMARTKPPETIYTCGCANEHEGHYGDDAVGILPYGEDTPIGWASTGLLISRFRLSCEETLGGGLNVWSELDGREIACAHLDRCRGAAEWVAEHGAAAIAREKA